MIDWVITPMIKVVLQVCLVTPRFVPTVLLLPKIFGSSLLEESITNFKVGNKTEEAFFFQRKSTNSQEVHERNAQHY